MSDALAIIIPFLFVAGLVSAIGAVVYFILRLRAGEPITVSLRLLLRVYLYLASLVSLLVLVGGLSALVTSGFGRAFGQEFSYHPEITRPSPVFEMGLEGLEGVERETLPEEMDLQLREEGLARAGRHGLIEGISTTIVAGIIFAVHWAGRRALESREERRRGILNRAYVFLLLVNFGAGTIITFPQALVQSITFALESGVESYRSPPGNDLATALVFVPFWLYYLVALLRQVRRGEE